MSQVDQICGGHSLTLLTYPESRKRGGCWQWRRAFAFCTFPQTLSGGCVAQANRAAGCVVVATGVGGLGPWAVEAEVKSDPPAGPRARLK